MADDTLSPMDAFQSARLGRMAQAAEAGQLPAHFLTGLRAEIETARERSQAEGQA